MLVGDFNLDYVQIYDDNYSLKNLFLDFDDEMSVFNIIQMIKYPTWSR